MLEPIRVAIADDHLAVREGLRLILEAEEGFIVVGSAADGATTVQMVGEHQPAVVLMDLRMPGMDGIEAMTHIRANWPQIAIVILTTYNENDLIVRGMQAGAAGYLLKDMSSAILFNTIRAAARGEMLLQPEIMARLVARASPVVHHPSTTRSNWELTEREREVLRYVARGERNKEIARRLTISESTIKAHLTSIFAKLDVDSRTAAVAVAIERGVLPREQRALPP